MSVSIKPLEDRIVIKQVEAEQTTASGSRHPGHRQGGSPRRARSWRSAPVASTTTATACPLDVAVGDRVIYSKYGGTEVKFGGDETCSCCRRATCWRSSSADFGRNPAPSCQPVPDLRPGRFGISAEGLRVTHV